MTTKTSAPRATSSADRAFLGVTVKSGWAAVVLLCRAPLLNVLDSLRVDLADPAVPQARQPYHDGFSTARRPGPELTRLLTSVHTFGSAALEGVLDRYASQGMTIDGAAIVVGSLIDPESLANEHMRIHAREGRLFRELVADTLARRGIPASMYRERDLFAEAAKALRRSEASIRTRVAQLGKPRSGPWRAEEKAAAVAAWLGTSQTFSLIRPPPPAL